MMFGSNAIPSYMPWSLVTPRRASYFLYIAQLAADGPIDVVTPGHSRSKDGVASLAYVPGIHVLSPYPLPRMLRL